MIESLIFTSISRLVCVLLVMATACEQRHDADESPFMADAGGVLNQDRVGRIEAYHQQLLRDLDIHFKVTILEDTPASIERTSARLFDEYSLGDRARGAKGLLLIIDLSATSRVIGFDHLNQWYVRDPRSEFAFGL